MSADEMLLKQQKTKKNKNRCGAKRSAVVAELCKATTGFCARTTSRAELVAECFGTNRLIIGGWWRKNEQQKDAAVAGFAQACATTGAGILA